MTNQTTHQALVDLNQQLAQAPVNFATVIETIETYFDFTPTAFKNGDTVNEANTNNGSCKIFGYAKLQGLSKQATLHAFGDFYSKDVLTNPKGEDHANIRNFIQQGWEGVQFEGEALSPKN